MKQTSLIILLFLSIFHTTQSMENLKKIGKKISASLIKKPKAPVQILDKLDIIAGQACIQAIKEDDLAQLELELLLGADVNYVRDGKSLFYLACEEIEQNYRDTELLKTIITHENIDISSRSSRGSTPLHAACYLGLTETVASMIKKSPQAVYYQDNRGSTPLHEALPSNCTQLLLTQSLNAINHQDYDGNTPLHRTCENSQVYFIELLIKNGANLTVQNHEQSTPLYIMFTKELLSHFIDKYRDIIRVKDSHNNTQMHLRATMPFNNPYQINLIPEYLSLLEAQGVNPAARNSDNKTAFDLAYEAYQELEKLYQAEQLPYIMEALRRQKTILDCFAPYATSLQKFNSPIKKQKQAKHNRKSVINTNTQYKDLSEAQRKCLRGVKEGDLPLLKEGLSHVADINFNDEQGYPLLSLACINPPKSILKKLLKHPVNLKATHTSSGNTALHTACINNRPVAVELLLQKDPTLAIITNISGATPFTVATMMAENTDCLSKILEYNPETANTIDDNNETPLCFAAKNQNNKQIELLLNANNSNINRQNNNGDTVLHQACNCTSYTKNICDIIKLLIVHGADTTIKNSNQATPLINLFSDISACEFKITDFLLAEHPDIFDTLIHTKDKEDNTQFHLCTQLQIPNDNFEQYLDMLKSHNLDIHAKNKHGNKAVDVAGKLYDRLYNRYAAKKLPYFKHPLDVQERIYHAFLRASELPTSSASFKDIFKQQSADGYELPRELVTHIMHTYYALNIETIVAKKYAFNGKYYNNFIENKDAIRQQLLAKPEPKLLWNA